MTQHIERRWFAIGDAQTTYIHFMQVLGRYGVLGPDGNIAPDVGLVTVGDYFDYGIVNDDNAVEVGREGTAILRWLAAHPPEQVVILLGNHDLARVQELAFETDASFRAAQRFARQVVTSPELRPAFFERYSHLPTPEVALRDFSAFAVEQRTLVRELLMRRRVQLAVASSLEGIDTLVTHAGVTIDDLANAGSSATRASSIADDINDFLFRAVDAIAPMWRRGDDAVLELSPLCTFGIAGAEGGGLVLHRPADPGRPGIFDLAWETDTQRVRRFDPRRLVPGVRQVCGHTSHARCIKEMPSWTDTITARTPPGKIRTISIADGTVRYRIGHHPESSTALHLIDGDINRVAAADYEILRLDDVRAT